MESSWSAQCRHFIAYPSPRVSFALFRVSVAPASGPECKDAFHQSQTRMPILRKVLFLWLIDVSSCNVTKHSKLSSTRRLTMSRISCLQWMSLDAMLLVTINLLTKIVHAYLSVALHPIITSFTHINISPIPGGINSSLSGLRRFPPPGCPPLGPDPGRIGNGPTGSNRAPGGAPMGGK